jgi:energy-coupling factor transport system substrate-specific component
MRELVSMWNNTRMVVLTAVTAALYSAILIPFKVIPLIPGVTELRPANAIPIVCSFLFGPAAAWGAAIGNVLGDFFGGFGPGDIFGFIGNFLYAFVPYKVWTATGGGCPIPRAAAGWWLRFSAVVFLASLLCASVIGWGLNLLGFHPFSLLAPVVLFNNTVSALLLAPPLLYAVYSRVAGARLLYEDMVPITVPSAARRWLGVVLVVAGAAAAFGAGLQLSLGRWQPEWMPETGPSGGTRALVVGLGVPPFLLIAVLGLCLL